jgi:hypothetical protein
MEVPWPMRLPGPSALVRRHAIWNPLPPPGRRLEGIPEILGFVDDLAVAELHNTHRVCQSPLIRDCVFRDPEIPVSENPFDLEAGRLSGMMTPQGLQIASPEHLLAQLGIIRRETAGSKITALVLDWVEDPVVRSDSRGFGVAGSFLQCASVSIVW